MIYVRVFCLCFLQGVLQFYSCKFKENAFRTLIHFEFIFVSGVKGSFNFTLIHVAVQFSQHTYLLSFLKLKKIFMSLLEYNCFTMLCQFLLYNKVNQLYVYIYPHISSLLSLPPTLPIPPLQVVTKHRADLPVLCSSFPLAIYFTFGSVYVSATLSLRPSFPSLPCVLKSVLYICVFIPAMPLGSSVPFFQIPHMCVSIWYLFFSF